MHFGWLGQSWGCVLDAGSPAGTWTAGNTQATASLSALTERSVMNDAAAANWWVQKQVAC